MGRSKATPVRFNNSTEYFTHQNEPTTRRPKKSPKKSHYKLQYTVLPPNESNEQYSLGEIWLGTSHNMVPESWTKCKANFVTSSDTILQMEFDSNIVVLIKVTNDFTFVKGLFTSKIFAMKFLNKDDGFVAQLFISEFPLPVFSKLIGSTIKMAVATIFGIQIEIEDTEISSNIAESKETEELYKNIKIVRNKNNSIPQIDVQHPLLKPTLRPYQEDAVRWMIYREMEPENAEILHPSYQPLLLKTETTLYFDKHTGYIDTTKPVVASLRTGGILADEMGLGKTVEVLACILSHPKPNEPECSEDKKPNTLHIDDTDKEAMTSLASDPTPIVLTQPKKRKRESNKEVNDNENSQEQKKIKVPNNWVKSSSKKSETRIALELWYQSMLQEVTTKQVSKTCTNKLQCICGDTDMTGAVKCVDCFKYQHATCLGYKKARSGYRCPQCWMEQPFLESKATLIVCPLSLRSQWSEEICKHLISGLRILIYEGSKAAPVYPTELREYDLILTTYNVLQTELRLSESDQPLTLRREPRYSAPGSPLARINWWRLCLDEAQAVEVSSCMISTMAKKLQACNRWAITGTPVTRDISDLYGLVDYLQLSPYNEFDTWHHLLYLPYLSGNMEPILQFLSQVMWRSSKNDVIEQINIPKQTVNEYLLEFSAVEKYYYKREHELCTTDFLNKLQSYDCSIPLRTLDKSGFKKLMQPLRSIRNACSHPNATRGRYLATRKTVTSMEDLLEALIEKNISDSEENLRVVVSALNGLAGIYLLLQNPVEAVAEYREVMHLAARFNSEDSKKGPCVDKLQLIHTMHNLAEVLETSPLVPPTLRDENLRQDCKALQEKYMERYINQNLVAYEESMTAINLVSQLQERSTLVPGQWYSSLIDWVTVKDLTNELHGRIDTLLGNANTQKLNFSNERKLLYFVSTWDEDITSLRTKTINVLNKMYEYSEENHRVTINEVLAQDAMDCHLRPQKKSKKNTKCLVCTVSVQMRQYEAKLFDMTKTRSAEDMSNKGSWKPTSEELVLKALLSIGKSRNADTEATTDGELYFSTLDAVKKEFKQLRKFWTFLDQQICAHDEINMCKIRLGLKEPDHERNKRQSNADKILKQLSTVLENKIEFINLVGAHELEYQASVLKSEEKQNMAALERNLGTHSYLETLRCQQYSGHSPDPCPICKNPLQEQWSILPCGHCYCLECIQLLLEKTNANRVACSICRQYQKIEDVSYIRTGEEAADKDNLKIKGNYSTKIEAVVQLVMKLKNECNDVKVLVFSTWAGVLNILKGALECNDIAAEHISVSQKISRSISNFKNEKKNITVLMLPIKLGSKGLNLIEATHVILLEPLLDPADELQAIGRVHRIGQTRPTAVHKFIVKNTIEESIHHATSSNADIWNRNKVTLQQLKNLFVECLEDQPVHIPDEIVTEENL